jgi:hypothetical protein
MSPEPAESDWVPGRCGAADRSPSDLLQRSKDYRVNTPLFMRNAEGYASRSKRSALFASCEAFGAPAGLRNGLDANRVVTRKKYSGSRYYPKIAPFSPHFVGRTFSSSHTIMEAVKRGGLIASSEARIVDPRHASNRFAQETQSAARRRITRPQMRSHERISEKGAERAQGRSSMSPATTGGWITNFVDRGHGQNPGLRCRPDDGVACVWSSRPRLSGEDESRRGEAAQQSSAGEFATACCDVKRV